MTSASVSMAEPSMRKEALLSRRQVEAMIADGRSIIIVDGKVLKVDTWLKYHPGGDIAIKHMVGRDATDEVNALHSKEARSYMSRYQVGRIEGRWVNFLPPLQGGKFRKLDFEGGDQLESAEEATSSDGSTPPDSPVFDALDKSEGSGQLRKRKRRDLCETSSISSLSSIEPVEAEQPQKLGPMDARTQREIDFDLAIYPALDSATQDDIVHKYRTLFKRMEDEGLFLCNYAAYAVEMCRYLFLFGMFHWTLNAGYFALSGLFLGLLWHQLVFTVHDAGHMGITHHFQIDTVIGIVIADFIGGLSVGWWKRNHNVHHIVTNAPEHDPDIEHMPFFAISHRFFDSLRSTYYDRIMTYDSVAKFTLRYQHYLYYPILLLGRFNLYALSWQYLLTGQAPKKGPAWWHRYLEIAGQIFFWYWFGYRVVYQSIPTAGSRWAFVLISHLVTAPVHVQITLSHFAMSTADLGINESFPQKMLRTTMDVDCPQWLDFLHGGLQFQVIHHLYPRMPRHNLRRAQKLVKEYCDEVRIPYAIYGFIDGSNQVLGRLADIGRQAAILAECQKNLAKQKDFGMHEI